MTQAGYVVAGYAVTFAGLVGYAAWVVGRRRALERDLPGELEDPDPRWR